MTNLENTRNLPKEIELPAREMNALVAAKAKLDKVVALSVFSKISEAEIVNNDIDLSLGKINNLLDLESENELKLPELIAIFKECEEEIKINQPDPDLSKTALGILVSLSKDKNDFKVIKLCASVYQSATGNIFDFEKAFGIDRGSLIKN